MKVIKPTINPQTGGYTNTHKGYDHAGLNLPDEIRAGEDGTITTRVDLYNSSWINNGVLTTRDYGNFIIIKHTGGTSELHAHLKQGSALNQGAQVKAGQVVGRIGNTGNSTGPHLHSEYRNTSNVNVPVEFIASPLPVPTPPMDNNAHKAAIAERIVKAREGVNYDVNKMTEQQSVDFASRMLREKDRAVKWDQLCNLAFQGGVDSNKVTVDQLKAQLSAGHSADEIAKAKQEGRKQGWKEAEEAVHKLTL